MGKVFITGASGFVGGFLVDEALDNGLEVYAALRETSDTSYLPTEKINIIYPNLNDVDELALHFQENQYDYIIHNAGLTKTSNSDQYYAVNVGLLENILNAVDKADLKLSKFVFISSLAAYGPADFTEGGIVKESSTPNPVTHYGKSKLAAEKILKAHTTIPFVIIRPTAVYGPREKDLFAVYSLINKGLSLSIGLVDQKLTFVYVKDLVCVILKAMLSNKRNVAYFVTDLAIYKSSYYNDMVRQSLDKKRILKLSLPLPLVRAIGTILEGISKATGKYPALNKEKVNELEAKSWVCDTDPLVGDLDYKPQYDLQNGLQECIQWYKENNWLK